MDIDYLFEPSASKELQLARQEYYKESSFVQMLLKNGSSIPPEVQKGLNESFTRLMKLENDSFMNKIKYHEKDNKMDVGTAPVYTGSNPDKSIQD